MKDFCIFLPIVQSAIGSFEEAIELGEFDRVCARDSFFAVCSWVKSWPGWDHENLRDEHVLIMVAEKENVLETQAPFVAKWLGNQMLFRFNPESAMAFPYETTCVVVGEVGGGGYVRKAVVPI